MQLIQGIKAKDIARYVFMPGVVPRVKELFGSGFGRLAFLMALVYGSVRLLPTGHPYLNPANMGRYGIRHVIAEAANRLVLKRQNIDQILVFFALLAGMVILALQFVLMIAAFVFGSQAHAGPIPFAGMFVTPFPANDVALMMLDGVFGVPGLFGSKVDTAAYWGAFPSPFHIALHGLFQFYSIAILLVATFIFLYYVLIVVGETMQTGVPFGKRFDKVWAPIRLVVAFGLLVPVNYGLNSAQYITLYAAKIGSAFATNGWILFNANLTNGLGIDDIRLIAKPNLPDIEHLVQFIMVARACKTAYEKLEEDPPGSGTPKYPINPYFVQTPDQNQLVPAAAGGSFLGALAAYTSGLTFYENNDVVIRFGHLDDTAYAGIKGHVLPLCGEITIPTTVPFPTVDPANLAPLGIAAAYLWEIMEGWYANQQVTDYADRATRIYVPREPRDPCAVTLNPGDTDCTRLPGDEFKTDLVNQVRTSGETGMFVAWLTMITLTDFTVPPDILDRGWGGAGIWYNRIAQWNGALLGAANNIPIPNRMPQVMMDVEDFRRTHDDSVGSTARFALGISDKQDVEFRVDGEADIAIMLQNIYDNFKNSDSVSVSDLKRSGNVFIDTINAVFGSDSLFNIRQNDQLHPLAQLVALGKSMIDMTIRNLMVSYGFAFLGGMGSILEPHMGSTLHSASQMFLSVATLTLTIGFVLYYVLPFLPFIYFFFAVGGWVKSIFEAMVGVPLWALAHMRIDGNGLPGDTAMSGYFLIFEIFVRPILTVFGLLASMSIFAAMVHVLHDIFPLLTSNATGFDHDPGTDILGNVLAITDVDLFGKTIQAVRKNAIDELAFTVLYTIIVFMVGTSSFKLIDQIPNHILRWMGSGVSTFNDSREDPTNKLVGYATLGAQSIGGPLASAGQQAASAAGSAAGVAVKPAYDSIFGRNSSGMTGNNTGNAPSAAGAPSGGGGSGTPPTTTT